MKSPLRFCTASLVLFAMGCGEPEGATSKDRNDLQRIILASMNFYSSNRRSPSSAEELLPWVDAQTRTIIESDRYIIIWGYDFMDKTGSSSPANTIQGYHTSVPEKGGAVAYGDGGVHVITAEEFADSVIATAAE